MATPEGSIPSFDLTIRLQNAQPDGDGAKEVLMKPTLWEKLIFKNRAFKQFARLPTELRLRIWELALPKIPLNRPCFYEGILRVALNNNFDNPRAILFPAEAYIPGGPFSECFEECFEWRFPPSDVTDESCPDLEDLNDTPLMRCWKEHKKLIIDRQQSILSMFHTCQESRCIALKTYRLSHVNRLLALPPLWTSNDVVFFDADDDLPDFFKYPHRVPVSFSYAHDSEGGLGMEYCCSSYWCSFNVHLWSLHHPYAAGLLFSTIRLFECCIGSFIPATEDLLLWNHRDECYSWLSRFEKLEVLTVRVESSNIIHQDTLVDAMPTWERDKFPLVQTTAWTSPVATVEKLIADQCQYWVPKYIPWKPAIDTKLVWYVEEAGEIKQRSRCDPAGITSNLH